KDTSGIKLVDLQRVNYYWIASFSIFARQISASITAAIGFQPNELDTFNWQCHGTTKCYQTSATRTKTRRRVNNLVCGPFIVHAIGDAAMNAWWMERLRVEVERLRVEDRARIQEKEERRIAELEQQRLMDVGDRRGIEINDSRKRERTYVPICLPIRKYAGVNFSTNRIILNTPSYNNNVLE
ncbi:4306_t:CDS:2, partial [Paraglomus occultum]